jgi:peptidoglycan/LPS O-acetylase OafA/YrhL
VADPPATATSIEDRRTNLDAVRLIAALGVLIGHGFDLRRGGSIILAGIPMSSMCVMVFFVISGWLITASWDRDPRPLHYLRNRVLRIFPALIAVVLATTLVLGPTATTLTTSAYFSDPLTWKYLGNAALLTRHASLPGVFTTNPYPTVVNGSLWTLPIEFACYLAVPLVCLLPVRQRFIAVSAIAVAAITAFYKIPLHVALLSSPAALWCMLFAFFAAGAALRALAVILGHQRWLRVDMALFVIIAQAFLLAVQPGWGVIANWLALPYVVMSLSLSSTPVLRRMSRFGDFSYGLYLWAYPVQQVVIWRRIYPPMWIDLPLVAAIAGCLAALSWFMIENPSLALKRVRRRPARHRVTGSAIPEPEQPARSPSYLPGVGVERPPVRARGVPVLTESARRERL